MGVADLADVGEVVTTDERLAAKTTQHAIGHALPERIVDRERLDGRIGAQA